MRAEDNPLIKIREKFRREMFEKVLNMPDYTDLKSNVFNVIVSLGIQLIDMFF